MSLFSLLVEAGQRWQRLVAEAEKLEVTWLETGRDEIIYLCEGYKVVKRKQYGSKLMCECEAWANSQPHFCIHALATFLSRRGEWSEYKVKWFVEPSWLPNVLW